MPRNLNRLAPFPSSNCAPSCVTLEALEPRQLLSAGPSATSATELSRPISTIALFAGPRNRDIASRESSAASNQTGDAPDRKTASDPPDRQAPVDDTDPAPALDPADSPPTADPIYVGYNVKPETFARSDALTARSALAAGFDAQETATEHGATPSGAAELSCTSEGAITENTLPTRPVLGDLAEGAPPTFALAQTPPAVDSDALPISLLANAVLRWAAAASETERPLAVAMRGGIPEGLTRQLAYHFASVNAATFGDAIERFINNCAALTPPTIDAGLSAAHTRAIAVTAAVVAVDAALALYVLQRRTRHGGIRYPFTTPFL